MGRQENPNERSNAENFFKLLQDLKASSQRLEGPVQKYPRSGKGIFKKVQDRYIAAIPVEPFGQSSRGSEGQHRDELEQVQLWQSGMLAYWESVAGYKQGGKPKGSVPFLKIAKVCVCKDDARGRSVVVKHKRGDDFQELVLCFPTKRDADEWSYVLWELISMLRGEQPGTSFVHNSNHA